MRYQCSYCTEPHTPACERCGERDPDQLLMQESPDASHILPDLCLRCSAEMFIRPYDLRVLSTYPPLVCIGFHGFCPFNRSGCRLLAAFGSWRESGWGPGGARRHA